GVEGPEVEVSAPGGSGGLVSLVSGPVLISAPMPAFYEYGKESFEWQLVVRAVKRADLLALLSLVDTSMWRFDLEPPSLL
ncbi:hypothetical protein FWH13_02510, partial [Candidatus Saccharibacteria bacterium]|nr:hypothetical protein [Candidatus Saccharibacteria bacterium]